MTAIDTSIVVAGLVLDHAHHRLAREVLEDAPAIPGHVALESYSVLTRLPLPGRIPPPLAAQLLHHEFAGRFIALGVAAHVRLLATLARLGIAGGGVYDALVAATALEHGLTLRSLDRRAAGTYAAVGVAYELVG